MTLRVAALAASAAVALAQPPTLANSPFLPRFFAPDMVLARAPATARVWGASPGRRTAGGVAHERGDARIARA